MNMTRPPTETLEKMKATNSSFPPLNVGATDKRREEVNDGDCVVNKFQSRDWKGRAHLELPVVPNDVVNTGLPVNIVAPCVKSARSIAELSIAFSNNSITRITKHHSHVKGQEGTTEPRRREMLIIFIRIIFRCLDRHADHNVSLQAKQVVKECTRKNRERVPGYENLVDAIQVNLRTCIGDVHWHRAEEYMQQFMLTRCPRIASNTHAKRFHPSRYSCSLAI